jgi:fused signal recognition particle receptor
MGLFDVFKSKELPKSATAEPPLPEEKAGWLSRIRSGLKKTTALLNTDIRDLFKGTGRLVDDDFLNELRAILVKTDMGPAAASEIVERIGNEYRARVVEISQLLGSVKTELRSLLAQGDASLKLNPSGPTIIIVAGVNGSGKTTSIAKLTHLFRQQGKKVVLGAGDTFRAAAVQTTDNLG